jgi:hypothetical protein
MTATVPKAMQQSPAALAEDVADALLRAVHHQGAHRHRPGELHAVFQVFRC